MRDERSKVKGQSTIIGSLEGEKYTIKKFHDRPKLEKVTTGTVVVRYFIFY